MAKLVSLIGIFALLLAVVTAFEPENHVQATLPLSVGGATLIALPFSQKFQTAMDPDSAYRRPHVPASRQQRRDEERRARKEMLAEIKTGS